MTFHVEFFNSAGDLVQFVNDQGIAQANIQRIEQRDGKWYIFYWA